MSTTAEDILEALHMLAKPEKLAILSSFFKTGPGEYGEGDQFIGVNVPDQRKLVQAEWKNVEESELSKLLQSPWHEARLTAALIVVKRFEKARQEAEKAHWVNFYCAHRAGINNWDLVDVTAPQVLGSWFFDKDRSSLHAMTLSDNLWEVRMGILATFYFIRKGQFEDTLQMIERLLPHPHDLIHKACGWMLREIGKRDQAVAESFLRRHQVTMPRTMLRYAIEQFPPEMRRKFMEGKG